MNENIIDDKNTIIIRYNKEYNNFNVRICDHNNNPFLLTVTNVEDLHKVLTDVLEFFK